MMRLFEVTALHRNFTITLPVVYDWRPVPRLLCGRQYLRRAGCEVCRRDQIVLRQPGGECRRRVGAFLKDDDRKAAVYSRVGHAMDGGRSMLSERNCAGVFSGSARTRLVGA